MRWLLGDFQIAGECCGCSAAEWPQNGFRLSQPEDVCLRLAAALNARVFDFLGPRASHLGKGSRLRQPGHIR